MNRRQFLRGAAIASAAGLVAKAEALDYLARQPVSVGLWQPKDIWTWVEDQVIRIDPLANLTGPGHRYLLTCRYDPEEFTLDDGSGATAIKYVHVSNASWPGGDELAIEVAKRTRELLSDMTLAIGRYREYKAAGYPLPSRLPDPVRQTLEELIYNISPAKSPLVSSPIKAEGRLHEWVVDELR